VSTTSEDTCLLCVQQEAAKLISICVELGLELKTREDVLNLMIISGYCSLYRDNAFVENVIDAVLEQM